MIYIMGTVRMSKGVQKMNKDIFTILVGGQAGQGIKKAGSVAANYLNNKGRFIFQMNDYQSLIRGGHNFSIVSSSLGEIDSHYMKADLVVALDKRSYDIHKKHVKDSGVLVYNKNEVESGDGIGISIEDMVKEYESSEIIKGVTAIASLAACINLSESELKEVVKQEYTRNFKANFKYASKVYTTLKKKIKHKFEIKQDDKNHDILHGNECIALGAASGGLNLYFAYPMTPASGLLHFFAKYQNTLKIFAIHAENEISVANMAIGASFTGAKAMVGTSGGGFGLMQEAFSLAGMAEAPVLFVLGQRSGPSTGVPTYTEQADLMMAVNAGHGEFPRILASPGSFEEAFYLTAELLDIIWHFQIPGILLSEKHLLESRKSIAIEPSKSKWARFNKQKSGEYKRYRITKNGVSEMLFPPSEALIKWNSYEHDEYGLTTEDAEMITKMHDKRNKKQTSLIEYMRNIKTVNKYGSGKLKIFTFGSSTMSVLEAVKYGNIDAAVIQPIYLKPFPEWEFEKFDKQDKIIVVEQNSTGQLESMLKEKAGLQINKSIRRYDGRPFDPVALSQKIKEVL